jgi:hypothetical protein
VETLGSGRWLRNPPSTERSFPSPPPPRSLACSSLLPFAAAAAAACVLRGCCAQKERLQSGSHSDPVGLPSWTKHADSTRKAHSYACPRSPSASSPPLPLQFASRAAMATGQANATEQRTDSLRSRLNLERTGGRVERGGRAAHFRMQQPFREACGLPRSFSFPLPLSRPFPRSSWLRGLMRLLVCVSRVRLHCCGSRRVEVMPVQAGAARRQRSRKVSRQCGFSRSGRWRSEMEGLDADRACPLCLCCVRTGHRSCCDSSRSRFVRAISAAKLLAS